MNRESNKRRAFLKASLVFPLLSGLPWRQARGNSHTPHWLAVPNNIYFELIRLYGAQAQYIELTDKIELDLPEIAENGAVVPMNVRGEKGLVSSVALFDADNPNPLIGVINLHRGVDLPVGSRAKVGRTSDIYLVGQTRRGLVGLMRQVKVTVGCGGG